MASPRVADFTAFHPRPGATRRGAARADRAARPATAAQPPLARRLDLVGRDARSRRRPPLHGLLTLSCGKPLDHVPLLSAGCGAYRCELVECHAFMKENKTRNTVPACEITPPRACSAWVAEVGSSMSTPRSRLPPSATLSNLARRAVCHRRSAGLGMIEALVVSCLAAKIAHP